MKEVTRRETLALGAAAGAAAMFAPYVAWAAVEEANALIAKFTGGSASDHFA